MDLKHRQLNSRNGDKGTNKTLCTYRTMKGPRTNYGLWGGSNYMNNSVLDKLELPYSIETVESFNGEYSQEEIEIAEAIFAWWISGLGYEEWYSKNIAQQKIDFDIVKDEE